MVSNPNLGDLLRLKKPHPCGGSQWEVVRLGADIKIRCVECDRLVMLTRQELSKRVTRNISQKTGVLNNHHTKCCLNWFN